MEFVRSPLLMNQHDTALLIVDIQEKLLSHIDGQRRLLWNTQRLIEGARTLDVRIAISEQYPKGLGNTVGEIAGVFGKPTDDILFEKTMFSCRECSDMIEQFSENQIKNVLLAGIETHVCVMQTALDFLAAGFEVYVCNDAVGSRFENDHRTALSRMESSGVTMTTTEAALFEWCERAGSDQFKTISNIVRKEFPA